MVIVAVMRFCLWGVHLFVVITTIKGKQGKTRLVNKFQLK